MMPSIQILRKHGHVCSSESWIMVVATGCCIHENLVFLYLAPHLSNVICLLIYLTLEKDHPLLPVTLPLKTEILSSLF